MPIWIAMKISPLTMAVIIGLGSGVMNMVPWGGPTLRAATVFQMDVSELYRSVIPMQIFGLILALIAAVILGFMERKAIGYVKGQVVDVEMGKLEGAEELRRPKLVLVNVVLVIVLMWALIAGWASSAVLFVIGLPIALIINYGFNGVAAQRARIEAHSINALGTGSVLFSAGIFSGVLSGTGMLSAMASALASIVPNQLGGVMQYVMVVFSVPLTFIFDPDSFYYGVLPVLAEAAEQFGVDKVYMIRAAIIGFLSTGSVTCPLIGSTWLIVGLCKINLGDLQKKAFPFAIVMTLLMGCSGSLLDGYRSFKIKRV
jgi:CitMHS family citrate-Mg2+:H+ or citrate-Ca2+:H+ symporter